MLAENPEVAFGRAGRSSPAARALVAALGCGAVFFPAPPGRAAVVPRLRPTIRAAGLPAALFAERTRAG